MSTIADNLRADNLHRVQQNIKHCAEQSGRDSSDITLVAVSKTRSLSEVQSVVALGQTTFAENTIQDAMSKIPHLSNELAMEWHFIGHLQSKKAGKIPGYFQWIHSVDSIKLAQKLSSAMLKNYQHAVLNCLIQVNVSGEESKYGLTPEQLKGFLQQLSTLALPCLQWRGLMTIGVRGDEQKTRKVYAQLRALQENCRKEFALENFDQLSMGMSDDYCLAIEEGATIVRVGTSIFGKRE
jgi:pyridoxal phosphate enzyme (YggS family)